MKHLVAPVPITSGHIILTTTTTTATTDNNNTDKSNKVDDDDDSPLLSWIQTKPFSTDPVWLKQVLLNLIVNAIKLTPRGGGVDLHVTLEDAAPPEEEEETTHPKHASNAPPSPSHEDDDNHQQDMWLQITIRDTGIGMTKVEIERLFGVFCQANKQISAQFGGSGLGLHIVKSFLDRIGVISQWRVKRGLAPPFMCNSRYSVPKK